MKYDIIGDIHGHADELEMLLVRLGYQKDDQGTYRHPEADRQAIFVGDFVDRGAKQFQTIDIARKMVDAGQAQAIMGNHELNAGMYHTYEDKGGERVPMRAHNEKNNRQHQAFMKEYDADPAQGDKNIQWLKNLPLYLDLNGIRVVHALWDDEAIKLLHDNAVIDNENRIAPDKWGALVDTKAPLGRAVERLTKGIVINLPAGISYPDPDGHIRTEARLKWWVDPKDTGLTMDQVTLDVPRGRMPKTPVPDDIRQMIAGAQTEGNTVFFGHYWQQGEFPMVESKGAICIDQSIAKGGHLAAATVTVDEGKLLDVTFTSVKNQKKASDLPSH